MITILITIINDCDNLIYTANITYNLNININIIII